MIKCFIMKNKHLFFLVSVSLLVFISNFVFVNNVFADVPQIVFSTSTDQNIAVNVPGTIKISIVDPSNDNKATETIYLNLSTSGNGEFSSNKDTWKPLVTLSSDFSTSSVYISTNSASRTLYYKGLSEGAHIITVSAKSRSGVILNNVEQTVNIGATPPNTCTSFTYSSWGTCSGGTQTRTVSTQTPESCSGGSPALTQSCTTGSTSTSTSTSTNSATQITKTVTRIVYVSAHSGEEDLSDYNEKTAFETSAGRERMAVVGSPLEFVAKYKLSQDNQCTPNFKWNFGDGFEASGKIVEHVYKYAGEFQVVLNSVCGEYNSVSRTVAKTIIPKVSISNLPNGDTEISNNGNTEINIENYKIKGVQKDFIFPKDSIISAGNKITISKEDFSTVSFQNGFVYTVESGSSTTRVSVNNPTGREVAYFDANETAQQNTSVALSPEIVQTEISQNTQSRPVATALKIPVINKKEVAGVKPQIKLQTDKNTNVVQNDNNENLQNTKKVTQTATVLESENLATTSSFWSKVVSLPASGIKSFAHLFYDF